MDSNAFKQLEAWARGIGLTLSTHRDGYVLQSADGKPLVLATLEAVTAELRRR